MKKIIIIICSLVIIIFGLLIFFGVFYTQKEIKTISNPSLQKEKEIKTIPNPSLQKEIKSISNSNLQRLIMGISFDSLEKDTIILTGKDLKYLISKSYVICSKIDTLDDGRMIKTVEIESKDTTFRFVGAYIESNVFSKEDTKFIMEVKPMRLICRFALIDDREFYKSYELDKLGMRYFEKLLNNAPPKCIDENK